MFFRHDFQSTYLEYHRSFVESIGLGHWPTEARMRLLDGYLKDGELVFYEMAIALILTYLDELLAYPVVRTT